MRRFLLSAFVACSFAAQGQTVATCESLPLAGTDTFYVNYNNPGTDVGFASGYVHFPCFYDTSWGGLWSGGFSFSNMTDTQTSGYLNQYAAKTGMGYNGSAKYLVFWQGYSAYRPSLVSNAQGKPAKGFYITNSTYAYNSMRDGDFIAKKFGGVPNTDPDWFKLTVKGFLNGNMKADSVEFYLADFRSADSTKDYILNEWKWVNLLPLGAVDSLDFVLSSSDVGSFGMNTPAYFCLDNFTTQETNSSTTVASTFDAKIYPNPAQHELNIGLKDFNGTTATIMDASGKVIMTQHLNAAHTSITVSNFSNGLYWLVLNNNDQQASVRFVKQ